MAGPGYIPPQPFTLPVSGALRFQYTIDSAPWASFQLYRTSGLQDATYRIWTSNFSQKDVAAAGLGTFTALSGSNLYYAYWYPEPGCAGTAFTGSVTDAPTPFLMHTVDNGAKHIMVEISSSYGGNFVLYPHIKGA